MTTYEPQSEGLSPFTFIGNVIWLVCGGFFSAVGYWVSGIALCLTIIGIPFGIQTIKFGTAMLAPFGRQIHEVPEANHPIRIVLNVIWLFTSGTALAINHLIWAGLLAITVVGLPFGMQHIKLIPLALFPFGRRFGN